MAKYVLKEDVEEPKAYCMKCKKKKRKIMNGELVKAEGAERYFFKGTHKVCGSGVSVVVSKDSVIKVGKKKKKSKKS